MTKMEVVLDEAYPNAAFVKWPYGFAEIHGSRVGRESKARLFAASEELLEAATALLTHLDYLGMTREEEPMMEALRTAIAKATGGFTP